MTWTIKITVVLVCLWFIWGTAKYQAKLFDKQVRINHTGKAVLFLLFCQVLTLPFILFRNYWPLGWQIPALCLLERLAFFDIIINAIRHKPFAYNGATIISGSFMDGIENKLPQWVTVGLRFLYIIIFVIVLIVL